jgi:hypothetical protein
VGGDAGTHRLAGGVLGCFEGGVGLGEALGWHAHDVVAGAVRAVAVQRAADVDDDRIAFDEGAGAGLVVRARAVRTRADDHEVHLLVPFGEDEVRDVAAHLLLGAAGAQQGGDLCVDPVDRLSRAAQRVDLSPVLAHPQLPGDRRGAQPVRRDDRLLQAEQERRPQPVPRPPAGALPDPVQRVAHHGERVIGLPEVDDLDLVGQPGVHGAGPLEGGDDEDVPAITPGDEQRQALQRQRVVAGQVPQVGAGADEEGVDASCLHGGDGAGQRVGGHGADIVGHESLQARDGSRS